MLLVTDAAAAAQKLAAPAAFKGLQRIVKPGQEIEGEALAGELEAFGYFRDDRVDEPGEMAIRGLGSKLNGLAGKKTAQSLF